MTGGRHQHHARRPTPSTKIVRVADDPVYRTDLYKGTSAYYERYRLPYPDRLLDDLRARVPITGRGRLLDLACGTGQIAFALAPDFAEVWGVDQEEESIAFATEKARRSGVRNAHWIAATAEDVLLEGRFELIAIGNAFHRLHRHRVAERSRSQLSVGGCLALLWGGSPWSGSEPWQRMMDETLERWMHAVGAADRVPAGWQESWTENRARRSSSEPGWSMKAASSSSPRTTGPWTRSSGSSIRPRFSTGMPSDRTPPPSNAIFGRGCSIANRTASFARRPAFGTSWRERSSLSTKIVSRRSGGSR